MIDFVLVLSALAALSGVLWFLVQRPGRKHRIEVASLVSQPAFAALRERDDDLQLPDPLPDHCVFISYRRVDAAEIVGRLDDHLARRLGRNAVFKDVHSLRPGADFRTQIEQSLVVCRVLLCVMGDRWAQGASNGGRAIDEPVDFVRIEVETALRRGIPVIPVFIRGFKMPAEDFFPVSIQKLANQQGAPLRPDPDFIIDVRRLLKSMESYLDSDRKS